MVTKFSLVVLPLLFIGGEAAADPVDQPGNYTWATGSGTFEFNQASPFSANIPSVNGGSAGTLDTDLDSAGNITFNAFTIPMVTAGGYDVTLQVLVAGSSGTVDASTNNYNVSTSLQFRFKFGPAATVGSNCLSPTFTRSVEAAYVYTPASPPASDFGTLEFYSGTGGSVGGTTGWLEVPLVTATCNGHTSTINSTYGFGNTNKGLRFTRLTAITSPGFTGS